jgi:hypothetical protein
MRPLVVQLEHLESDACDLAGDGRDHLPVELDEIAQTGGARPWQGVLEGADHVRQALKTHGAQADLAGLSVGWRLGARHVIEEVLAGQPPGLTSVKPRNGHHERAAKGERSASRRHRTHRSSCLSANCRGMLGAR